MNNLPFRYILIDKISKPLVIKLNQCPYLNTLIIKISFHIFPSNSINDSIIDSFISNESNETYVNGLELIQKATFDLILDECENFVIKLQRLLDNNKDIDINNNLIELDYSPKFKLTLTYKQIFKINNFILDFVNNYNYYKDKISNVKIEENNIVENNKTLEEKNYKNLNLYFEETLKLCDNNILQYFIYKHIKNLINSNSILENEFDILYKDKAIYINLNPLLNINLMGINNNYYSDLLLVINSIEYNQEDTISLLKKIYSGILYLLYLFVNGKIERIELVLPLKIMDILIFILGLKISNTSITNNNLIDFYNYYENLINNCSNYILNLLDNKYDFINVNIYHNLSQNFNDEININDKFKQNILKIINDNKYLLDIDKKQFINLCLTDLDNAENSSNKFLSNIYLNHSKIINIAVLLKYNTDKENNSLLSYSLIKHNIKEISDRIITQDYFNLLRLTFTPNILNIIKDDIDPILLRYLSIIKDNILKNLIKLNKNNIVNTFDLLNNYIKPYLINNNTSIKTELYILYKIVIPYLYDFEKIEEFEDYFH